MKKDSKNKGITLIALIITIIVLIILSGIAINLTLKENGIFNKAQLAKEKHINATKEEEEELNNMYGELLLATNDDAKVTMTVKELKQILNENKTKETVLWEGTANKQGEYKFINESYDINNYDRIIIEHSQNGNHKSSTSLSKANITKDETTDIGLWGYDTRYTILNFTDNGFVIKSINGTDGYYIYVESIIGIKY